MIAPGKPFPRPGAVQQRVFWQLALGGTVLQAFLCAGAMLASLPGLAWIAGMGVFIYLGLMGLMKLGRWNTVIVLTGVAWWLLVRELVVTFGYEANFQLYFLLLTFVTLLFEHLSLRLRVFLGLLPLFLFLLTSTKLSSFAPEVTLSGGVMTVLQSTNIALFTIVAMLIVLYFAFAASLERTRAEKLAEARAWLVANLSHELKTPIAAMLTTAQSMLLSKRSGEDYEEALRLCERNLKNMGTLVQRMLDLSHAGSDAWEPQLREVDPAVLLETCRELHRPLADEKGVALRVDCLAGNTILTDDGLLAVILNNLVANALLYTPAGKSVTLAFTPGEKGGVFTVSDEGPGIPPEALPHIFDAFYRADTARTRSGANYGLGLSVAAELARRLGIKIEVDSRPGEGCVFKLNLT